MENKLPEVWLRGPLDGIPALVQPVAAALLQAREEVPLLMQGFTAERLWIRPQGMASVGFHLQHLKGVLDRLFTYAEAKALSPIQLTYLDHEGIEPALPISVEFLVDQFIRQVDYSIRYLAQTDPATLTEYRAVGRSALPSTVGGLLFHAAEHTSRHLGQLLVTARMLRA